MDFEKLLKDDSTYLNLNGKCIGIENMKSLCKILIHNNTVTRLDLMNNKIGSEEVKLLSVALQKNNTLEYLNLSYNSIYNSGITCLCDVLFYNNTLIFLNLNNNFIRNEGIKLLYQSMRVSRNETMTEIRYLYENYIEMDRTTMAFDKLLIRNKERRKERIHNEKNREEVKLLLLLSREFLDYSLFYKDCLPLDLFKIIYKSF